MTRRGTAFAALLAGVAATTACGSSTTGVSEVPKGLAACPAGPFLTVAPIDPGLLTEISPLGAVEPSAHVFPSDHMYFYTAPNGNGRVEANVVAPGDITLVEVKKLTRNTPPVVNDYALTFYFCTDVQLWFGHVQTLTAELSDQIGTYTDCDPTYVTGGVSYTPCRKALKLKLTAGTLMGTMGGPVGYGMDFGGYDRRVPAAAFIDPARSYGYGQPYGQNQASCPVEYFVPAIKSAYEALYGRQGTHRTFAPLCGTNMQDVPNTAQGRWFYDASPNEDPHLGLVRDNVDPTLLVFAIGTSIPSIPVGTRWVTPASSGRLNRDFATLSSDGLIYCYDAWTVFLPPPPARHILLQLPTPTTLRIEGVLGGSCGDPATWAFTGGAKSFSR